MTTRVSPTAARPQKAPAPLHQRVLVGPSDAEATLTERRAVSNKMVLDALKLRTEALSGVSPTARGINGGLKLVSGVQKAGSGDKFHAAASAASAMEKLTPVLSRSVVGATTSAVVLAYGDDQVRLGHKALKSGVKQALDPQLDRETRAHGALDATLGASQLAIVGRSIAKATGTVGRYALNLANRVPALIPVAAKAEEVFVTLGATRLGQSLKVLNKWIPLLNAAWVVMAAKTAIDVHHDPQASARSKALSLVALGGSTAVFGAGVLLGPWAFGAITVASIGADLALAYARKQDQAAAPPLTGAR
jgi:hypothetical protein